MSARRTGVTRRKAKPTWEHKPAIELAGVALCDLCDTKMCKAIDVSIACCEGCNKIGCEDLVSTDGGEGHCINGYGCSEDR